MHKTELVKCHLCGYFIPTGQWLIHVNPCRKRTLAEREAYAADNNLSKISDNKKRV